MRTSSPFGREPAFWLGLVGAVVTAVSAFLLHLTADQQGAVGAIAAVLVGLLTTAITRDGVSAAILGGIKAVFLLMISFGLHVPPQTQAVWYAVAAAALAGYVRTQVIAPVGPTPPAPAPQPR